MKNAGKGAGALGAAGFAGLLGLLFLSVALVYGLNKIYGGDHDGLGVPDGRAAVPAGRGRRGPAGQEEHEQGRPPDQKTIETVKDDVAFAKHPTTAPTRRTSV